MPTRTAIAALLVAAVAAVAAVAGCQGAGSSSSTTETTPTGVSGPDTGAAPTGTAGIPLQSVTWAIDWDRAGVTALETGGWSQRRADGLELEVHDGHVVVYILVLESCATVAERGRSTGPTPPPHSLPDHDSAMTVSRAVSVHTLESVDGSRHDFAADRFCEVGIGLLRGETNTENVPTDVDLDGVSLQLDGRYRTAPDQPWVALSLRSSLPAEADLALPDEAPDTAVTATVTLDPAALLTALDPTAPAERIALDMLEELATTATVGLTTHASETEGETP